MSKSYTNLPTLPRSGASSRASVTSRPATKLVVGPSYEKRLIEQLLREKEEYTRIANHLIEQTSSILDSNDSLQSELEATSQRYQQLQDMIEQYKKQRDYNVKKKENAMYKLKRYNEKYLESLNGQYQENIHNKIAQKRAEIADLNDKYQKYEVEYQKEQDTVKLIIDYNMASKDLIQMNKELTEEALRLMGLFEGRKNNLPQGYLEIITLLQRRMMMAQNGNDILANEIGYSDSSMQDDRFMQLSLQLQTLNPYFDDLTNILNNPSRIASSRSSVVASSYFMSEHESEPQVPKSPRTKALSENTIARKNNINAPKCRSSNPRSTLRRAKESAKGKNNSEFKSEPGVSDYELGDSASMVDEWDNDQNSSKKRRKSSTAQDEMDSLTASIIKGSKAPTPMMFDSSSETYSKSKRKSSQKADDPETKQMVPAYIDANGNVIYETDTNYQSEREPVVRMQQNDHNGHPMFTKNGDPIFDDNQLPNQMKDDKNGPLFNIHDEPIYDISQYLVQKYDEKGKPVLEEPSVSNIKRDKNGNKLKDKNGDFVYEKPSFKTQQIDQHGKPLFDENNKPIFEENEDNEDNQFKDHNGYPIYDLSKKCIFYGNSPPKQKKDLEGHPIYKNDKVVYCEDNYLIPIITEDNEILYNKFGQPILISPEIVDINTCDHQSIDHLLNEMFKKNGTPILHDSELPTQLCDKHGHLFFTSDGSIIFNPTEYLIPKHKNNKSNEENGNHNQSNPVRNGSDKSNTNNDNSNDLVYDNEGKLVLVSPPMIDTENIDNKDILVQKLDKNGKLVFDDKGKPVLCLLSENQPKTDLQGRIVYDKSGNPIFEDKSNENKEKLNDQDKKKDDVDEDEPQFVQKVDSKGNLLFDAKGKPILEEIKTEKSKKKRRKHKQKSKQMRDHNGNPMFDLEGNPIDSKENEPKQKLDDEGNPIFDKEGNKVYDENEYLIPTFDENGKIILDEDGNPILQKPPIYQDNDEYSEDDEPKKKHRRRKLKSPKKEEDEEIRVKPPEKSNKNSYKRRRKTKAEPKKYKYAIIRFRNGFKKRNRVHLTGEQKALLRAAPESMPNIKLIPKIKNEDEEKDELLRTHPEFKEVFNEEEMLNEDEKLMMSPPLSPAQISLNSSLEDLSTPVFISPSSPSPQDFRKHIIKRALSRRLKRTRLLCMITDSEVVNKRLEEDIRDFQAQIKLLEFEAKLNSEKLRFDDSLTSLTLNNVDNKAPTKSVGTDPILSQREIDQKKEKIHRQKHELAPEKFSNNEKRRQLLEMQTNAKSTKLFEMQQKNNGLEETILTMKAEIEKVKMRRDPSYVSSETAARVDVEDQLRAKRRESLLLEKKIQDSEPMLKSLAIKVNDLRFILDNKNKELAEGQNRKKPDVPKLWKQLEQNKKQNSIEQDKLKQISQEIENIDKLIEDKKDSIDEEEIQNITEEIEQYKQQIWSSKSAFGKRMKIDMSLRKVPLSLPQEMKDIEFRIQSCEREKSLVEKEKLKIKGDIEKLKRALPPQFKSFFANI
ncbi:hypothetical protein TVAG_223640 [Trichomonas vaginalis G3]|uniref:Uncharacterized protein n=1 Tax=Trichomonas vaginalis (strain ATCC PRA-98 / G3) TaxID=412133 RepID=A2EJ69_TRIV3|nr:hypothetical protein TVAGG3_0199090 [Trichomonas vaginalis G3]EAY07301.1 hypothetical protein TVAG_223640 [Trichomonas vaginalis G3]KAI5550476.1 hypothetical protein TVAGG3_0199090 [Trichomonas vaginalis G3]|eukprot:XP_001319524.1 hypothetical protein [Trichomonas vaginalis G3]